MGGKDSVSFLRGFFSVFNIAFLAQSVERILGKDEVAGSIPAKGSKPESSR
jgi:hypothetical protein